MVVYFGEEVEHALKTYLYTTRKSTVPLSGHENALFSPLNENVWVSRQSRIWLKNMPVKSLRTKDHTT